MGKPKPLIGVELLVELVESTLLTGGLKDGEPLSLLLIASPESCKTTVLAQKHTRTAMAFSDFTGGGIRDLCKSNPELLHIIINDMVAIMSHRESVNKYTLAVLNAMVEEGIQATAYPNTLQTYQKGKRGIIGCLPVALAGDKRYWWQKTGFASRMLPFCYDYRRDLTLRIHEAISSGQGVRHRPEAKTVLLRIPKRPVEVSIPLKESKSIMRIAIRVAQKLSEELPPSLKEKGFRRHHQLRLLAKGHALRDNRRVVTKKDVEFLERVELFISFTEPTKL